MNKTTKITKTSHTVTKLTKNSLVKFRVTAVNRIGKSESTESSDYVTISAPVTPEPPVIVEKLTSKTAARNTTVVLECVIKGNPTPEIKW